jgi:hypothetical protein
MPRQWIVNPGPDLVQNCADVGRFLESDYRLAIKNNSIPMGFEENFEPSGRKFVIIGAKSVPIATAKSVFLCLRLAGAESVVVKTASEDEGFMVQNVLDHWTPETTKTELFSIGSDKLRDLPEWNNRIEEATDLVVFGGEDTAKAFVEFENRKRNVYIHGPKFSFQVIHIKDLTMSRLADICFDFAAYYGEGCLSPKFCVLVGTLDPNWLYEASLIMQAEYGNQIEEFRNKLPLLRKSNLVQEMVSSNIVHKFVRLESISNTANIMGELFGDSRFVGIKSIADLKPFVNHWRNKISSVACLENDETTIQLLKANDVVRICSFGEMQFPHFYEQFDPVDDFDIYCQ